MKNHLILGNWNALCDSCGRKFKATSLQKRWDGLMVCEEDWEQRHPQDLLRVQREQISVPWSRPYPAQDTFIPQNLWVTQADALGTAETTAFNFTKNILDVFIDNGDINGFSLNSIPLNGGSISTGTETVVVTETLFITLGRFLADSLSSSDSVALTLSKVLSENIPIGESWYFTETEHTQESLSLVETTSALTAKILTESLSITESLTSKLISAYTLNGSVLNSRILG